MKHFFTLVLISVLFCSTAVQAKTFLVQPGGTNATWRSATAGEEIVDLTVLTQSFNGWYNNAAIVAGDEIWVIKGIYTVTDTVKIKGGEKLIGGFAGTETAAAQRAKGTSAWDFTNETVLDGNNAVLILGAAKSTTSGTLIDGITITKGKSTGTVVTAAGVVVGSNTIMQNCKVTNCETTTPNSSAGGVFVFTGGKLSNSFISENKTAGSGGGVISQAGTEVSGCTIDNNLAIKNAGGLYFLAGVGEGQMASNCIITNNKTTSTTDQGGAGLYAYQTAKLTTNIKITDCIISKNSSGKTGGGLNFNQSIADLNVYEITNCTIEENTGVNGAGINVTKGSIILNNCKILKNAGSGTGIGAGINLATTSAAIINNTLIQGNIVPDANEGSAIKAAVEFTANNMVVTANQGKNVISVVSTSTTNGCVFNNCTFAANKKWDATTSEYVTGAALILKTAATSLFTNCIAFECSNNPYYFAQGTAGATAPTVLNCGFEPSASNNANNVYTNSGGCITDINAGSFKDAANLNWALSDTSTAINAGVAIATCSPDIAGVMRPVGAAFDMGAYEYTSPLSAKQLAAGENAKLYFNPSTRILKIMTNAPHNVTVFNAMGQMVKQVKNANGIVDCSALPQGIYLIDINNNGVHEVKKISL